MKRVAFLLVAAVSLSACDRPDNNKDFSSYDPKYDGVATTPPRVDPSILEAQKAPAPPAPPATPAAPAATATSAPAATVPATAPAAAPVPEPAAPAPEAPVPPAAPSNPQPGAQNVDIPPAK